MLRFLVHKIFTVYINGVLNCKCPAPGAKGLNILDDSDHKFDIPATMCTNVAEQYAFSAPFFILLISVVFFSVAH
jgi:hypothetical protein